MISHDDDDDDVYVDNNYNDNGDDDNERARIVLKSPWIPLFLEKSSNFVQVLENSLNFLQLFFNAFQFSKTEYKSQLRDVNGDLCKALFVLYMNQLSI